MKINIFKNQNFKYPVDELTLIWPNNQGLNSFQFHKGTVNGIHNSLFLFIDTDMN